MKINQKAKNNLHTIKHNDRLRQEEGHLNHMNGISYDIKNPILALRMIANSSFFGEPNYYISNNTDYVNPLLYKEFCDKYQQSPYIDKSYFGEKSTPQTTTSIMTNAIDAALEYDLEATLKEAVRLRSDENIRTTPQIILVRAANHINSKHTGLIRKYAPGIIKRTDEPTLQLAYQLQEFGKPIPNSLKRAWGDYLNNQSEYSLAKYKFNKHECKLTDVVSMSHSNSTNITKLMNGTISIDDNTWESYISKHGSNKETWVHAIGIMGHMALLRNIRNMATNNVSPDLYLPKLLSTASTGKQLPFRYYTAYTNVEKLDIPSEDKAVILDSLDECLEMSLGNLPRFSGRTVSLCDNSGSTNKQLSEKSEVIVKTIANLTGIVTAKLSDVGAVSVFGDTYLDVPISKRNSILSQLKQMEMLSSKVGRRTECGLWKFFENIINNKIHWDNIFIYSDLQAGHGNLYGGLNEVDPNYKFFNTHYDTAYNKEISFIDVPKLLDVYRAKVNPNVKVFIVQVAGYKDTIIPEYYKDVYLLSGWGDGILKFANEMINIDTTAASYQYKK